MPKVLIVDDEAGVVRSTALLLQDLGYEVATCRRVEDFRRLTLEEAPDLILHDIYMPGLDLAEHARWLRADERTRDIPLVLFSAGFDVQEAARLVKPVAILEKPFTPGELAASVQRGLAARG